MMKSNCRIPVVTTMFGLALAPAALGQTWEAILFPGTPVGRFATDASIAVSEDRIVLATNEFLQLRHKNGNNILTVGEGLPSDLPFTPKPSPPARARRSPTIARRG